MAQMTGAKLASNLLLRTQMNLRISMVIALTSFLYWQ
jgi:hypothetical protein